MMKFEINCEQCKCSVCEKYFLTRLIADVHGSLHFEKSVVVTFG